MGLLHAPSHVLIMKRIEDEEEASEVEPSQMELWVQVLNLSIGLQSERVLREVGTMYVSIFVTVDEKDLNGN